MIDHRIFLKDGNKPNVCIGSMLCGVPLLWYRADQRNRTVKQRSVHGTHPETSPVTANSTSTQEESEPMRHIYRPSSSRILPHMTGAMSRRPGLGLRCITSSPVFENPPSGESAQRALKFNQAAALLCLDPNTGVTPDLFDGPVSD